MELFSIRIQRTFQLVSTIINVSFKDEVLMGQYRSVSVTQVIQRLTLFMVLKSQNRKMMIEESTRLLGGKLCLCSHIRISASRWIVMTDITVRCLSMTSKEKSFTLICGWCHCLLNEPISNVSKGIDKVIETIGIFLSNFALQMRLCQCFDTSSFSAKLLDT